MSLFQKSVVNKYLKNLNPETVDEGIKQTKRVLQLRFQNIPIRTKEKENYANIKTARRVGILL